MKVIITGKADFGAAGILVLEQECGSIPRRRLLTLTCMLPVLGVTSSCLNSAASD